MANCRNTQQLNITCGTDVVLHDKLMFDDEVFDPSVSVNIECSLVNSLGKRTSLEYEIADETLIIQIPWVDGRNAGCYGLEVRGKCNGKTWATYADSLIRYTRATVEGAAVVETESDWYDVTQVVSYRYSDSPLDEVDATIDDNYGEPTVTPTYEHNKLTLDFKNLRGNGIANVEQTTVSTEDEGVNETTITQDNGNTTVIQVRNGSKGSKGDKGNTGDSAIFDPSTGNISEMKQGTGDDELSPMSQKASTESFPQMAEDNNADLDVVDQYDNVLMRLENGGVKTKEFDSEKIKDVEVGNKDFTDLDFEDESGNVIMKVEDGHIKTKNFDSSNIVADGGGRDYDTQAEYNVFRRANQLKDIKFTPKGSFHGRNISYTSGTQAIGIPYSSVMECRKYVGLDVSIHTFMTAVNDTHSLLYTEVTGSAKSQSPSSAYGIEYHGPASCGCYYATVCSGYVSYALGLSVQFNTWEYMTKFFDFFTVLDNQDEQNIILGDVLWQDGHCEVITRVERDKNGIITALEICDHWEPIRMRRMSVVEMFNYRMSINGLWCRYKHLDRNTRYTPSTFVIAEGEVLYSVGDFVYVDGTSSRTFYRCNTSNKDAAFDIEKWDTVASYIIGRAYTSRVYVNDGEGLYFITRKIEAGANIPVTNTNYFKKIMGVYEWVSYPYIYNNDIVTFAGDRASFRTNDLIYINYAKSNYTSMQIYKDGTLVETLTLPNDDSYQIDVSSYCSSAGMYRARLTDGSNFSRYTYFEVLDTTASVTIDNGVITAAFSSINGTPLEITLRKLNGHPIWHQLLTQEDIKRGSITINAMALYLAQRPDGDAINEELFVCVAYSGDYGTAITEKVSAGTLQSIAGEVAYPNEPLNLTISANKNIILSGRVDESCYSIRLTASSSKTVAIIPSIGTIKWVDALPTLTSGKTYLITVNNGIANYIEV